MRLESEGEDLDVNFVVNIRVKRDKITSVKNEELRDSTAVQSDMEELKRQYMRIKIVDVNA